MIHIQFVCKHSIKKHVNNSVREKRVSKKHLIFSDLFNQIRMHIYLKFLQTFIMIKDDITVPASQIPVLVTALSIHYFSSSSQKRNLHESFQTGTFHHHAPNSHVSGMNFLYFLVHAFSITSCHS